MRVIVTTNFDSVVKRCYRKRDEWVFEDEVVGLNIPTGIPLVYELDAELKPIRHYYLGDADAAARAAAAVATQGKA